MPQTQAQRQRGFNQCVAQAAQTEHHALANSITEEAAGGLGILFSIGTGAASFEVAGEELASRNFFENLSGIELKANLNSGIDTQARDRQGELRRVSEKKP